MKRKVQIEKEWLEMVATIRKQDKRVLFEMSCIGYALGEHAKILGFKHPTTDEYIETDAPLPEYFSHLLNVLK